MKQIKIILLGILIISAYLLLPGCDDIAHQEYLNREKKVYLGITDSLASFPGEGRIKLKWYINADPKIEETVIYWNLRQDSIVKPFIREEKGIQIDSIIIDNLPEGTYEFELINKNVNGDRSLTSSVQGTSYGDSFRSTLKNRLVSARKIISYDMEKQTSDIEITWGSKPEGFIGTKISYKKRSSGQQTIVIVPTDESNTLLQDIGNRLNNADDILEISSLYLPDNCIDTLSTSPLKEQVCIYSASGTRTDYGNDGTIIKTITYNNIVKILNKASSMTAANVYDCDWIGDSPILSPSLFRITLSPTNTVKTEGYFNETLNSISDIEEGAFTPEHQKIKLNYRIPKEDGLYSIVEEEYNPADTSPRKVYSLAENKGGHFFSKENDLLQLDTSGKLWLYKPQANNTFEPPIEIASNWPSYYSVFYMPNNRIVMFSGGRIYSYPILDDNYTLGEMATLGTGWNSGHAITVMPFKDLALVMVNGTGTLRKISLGQDNKWIGSFTNISPGFEDYWKVITYENSLLAIDEFGDLWHMTLSDNFVLGDRVKIGSGWNKYTNVIKYETSLLCIDSNGDLWRYNFSPELPWNID